MSKKPQNTNQADSAWWYAQQTSRPTTTVMESFEVTVVGVTFEGRQGAIAKLRRSDRLILQRQPNNRYDQNAIEVRSVTGESIGFLNSNFAAVVAPRFDRLAVCVNAVVSAIVGEGSAGSHLGVRIRFELPLTVTARQTAPEDGVIDEIDLDDV